MGAVATFDPVGFAARYPEFGTVPPATLTAYAGETSLYFANDGTGPVNDLNQQLALINMLVAHLCQLNATVTGANGTVTPASPLVGRISSASEGSVSVSTDMGSMPSAAAYYAQTKYGTAFWAATAPYRTMQYVPRCSVLSSFGFDPGGRPGSGAPIGYPFGFPYGVPFG